MAVKNFKYRCERANAREGRRRTKGGKAEKEREYKSKEKGKEGKRKVSEGRTRRTRGEEKREILQGSETGSRGPVAILPRVQSRAISGHEPRLSIIYTSIDTRALSINPTFLRR